MNIFKKYLISIFLIVFLINTACGFAGMGGGNATTVPQNMTIPQEIAIQKPHDLINATESDQDILLSMHLIEYDAVQLQSQNKLLIKETLTFKNFGTKDFNGFLRTWLPDGSEMIKVSKSEMTADGESNSIDFNKTGNIISWQEYVEKNSTLPVLYAVEYTVAMKPGASSITGTYTKKLAYPTLINYEYVQIRSDLAPLIVKITKPQESSIKIFDENRNEITQLKKDETGDIYRSDPPQFKELNIEISGSSAIPAVTKSYWVYVVLGILILLVLLYPYISKKLKNGESGKPLKVTSSPYSGKSKEERSESGKNSVPSKEELKGNSDTESDPLRKELGLKLKDLETKYKSGDLLDEEYEDEKNAIQNKLKSMNKCSK
jgi:hypothetical protein